MMHHELCKNKVFKFQDEKQKQSDEHNAFQFQAITRLQKQLDISKSLIDKLKKDNAILEYKLKARADILDYSTDDSDSDPDPDGPDELGEDTTDYFKVDADGHVSENPTDRMTIGGVEYVVLYDGILIRRSDGMQYGKYCSRTGNVEVFEQCE
tara:strand:- start:75 stop:533 length:459 start_codon:yes stop_codon:yes gene_type:complete